MIKPSRLKPGDKVGLITPSSPAPMTAPTRYQRGISYLKKWVWKWLKVHVRLVNKLS